MKINEQKEREYIIDILTNILRANISLMSFYKDISTNKESSDICEKSIAQCEKGIKTINKIKHIEILRSLFNKIVSGKEYYFAMCGSLCSFEKIKTWDTTKKGFKEFILLEKQAQDEAKKEFEEKQRQKEFVENAEKEGKQVEMIYDEKTKTMKPIIVEEQ